MRCFHLNLLRVKEWRKGNYMVSITASNSPEYIAQHSTRDEQYVEGNSHAFLSKHRAQFSTFAQAKEIIVHMVSM